jgi:hypothetical protein
MEKLEKSLNGLDVSGIENTEKQVKQKTLSMIQKSLKRDRRNSVTSIGENE